MEALKPRTVQLYAFLIYYRIKVIINPSITSHFQGLEAVVCLVSTLILLKCLKKKFICRDGVCCIQWDKGNGNPRMDNLQLNETMSTRGSFIVE